MRKIQKYVKQICEELEGAKNYAECYVEYKAMGDSTWASRFKEMANNELRHAMFIHDLATQEIAQLNTVFTAPAEMQEAWDKSHVEYVEKEAWIKQMLAM